VGEATDDLLPMLAMMDIHKKFYLFCRNLK